MSGSKPHTVVVTGADQEVHVKPSKTSALRFAYETHQQRGVKVEVYAGDYVADRRVVDAKPVKVFGE